MTKLEDIFPLGNLVGRNSLFGSWGWWRGAKRGGRKPIVFRNSGRGRKRDGILKNPIVFLNVRAKFVRIQVHWQDRIVIDFAQGMDIMMGFF